MDAVAEIKRRLEIAEYVGRSVTLRKSGRNFRGLCPFHTEKTPSFYVFTDRGIWRCFGSCGEGGDLFSFVQKRENVEFPEALRLLAREAGVELSARGAERRGRAELLGSIVSAAVDFYQQALAGEGGATARGYLANERGLDAETIAQFRLGWAPDEWRALHDRLIGRGYRAEDAVAAGVLAEGESGGAPYDRFRGRVIVPIADERGRFVGLGGRVIGAGEPKYLNSPQTELFDKGRTLYGLDAAVPRTPAPAARAAVAARSRRSAAGRRERPGDSIRSRAATPRSRSSIPTARPHGNARAASRRPVRSPAPPPAGWRSGPSCRSRNRRRGAAGGRPAANSRTR